MKNDVLIDGGQARAKVRSPGLVLLFTLLTLGVYSWFWWYSVNRELAALGEARGTTALGTKPGVSVAAFTLGSLVWIPWLWTVVTTHRRIQAAQRITGGHRLNGWLSAMLWIFTLSLGGFVYMQAELNKVWHSPGMRPAEDPGPAEGDAERAAKLRQLVEAGALTEADYEAQRQRLGLP